jgi:hypothetical protein
MISPGAAPTELANTIADPDVARRVHDLYESVGTCADSFARAVPRIEPLSKAATGSLYWVRPG